MTIRTQDDLIVQVDQQLIWRRKELTEIRTLIQECHRDCSRQRTLIRAGVALLYAHWEGFIKISGTYLLEYISEQRCIHADLNPNILSIILRKHINTAKHSKKASVTGGLVEFFCTKMQTRARISTKDVIDTGSNLSSSILYEILWMLGLDETDYAAKRMLIDEKLVNQRNHIAHGEPLDITVDDFLALYDEVQVLLDIFRTQVQNACVSKTFLRATVAA